MSNDINALAEPLSGDRPCGENLEDTQLLASFDAYRIFGQDLPLSNQIDWREVRDKSLEALAKSKDIRLLTHLAAAVLRLDGLAAFFEVIGVAHQWLARFWDGVYPLLDDDSVLRKNALNGFADRMAVVDALRRAPVATHRQAGSFSLRELAIAKGEQPAADSDKNVPGEPQINAILEGTAVEDLQSLAANVTKAAADLKAIVGIVQSKVDFQSAPDFDPVLALLLRVNKLLTEHLAERTGSNLVDAEPGAGEGAVAGTPVGSIRSRHDAVRAMDAIAAYFRKNEPSSPIPFLLDRAKRLVSKNFLEVLADLAPAGVTEARIVSGVAADGTDSSN